MYASFIMMFRNPNVLFFSPRFPSLFDLKSLLQAALWLCSCWHLFLCCGVFRAVGTSSLLTPMISSLLIGREAWIHVIPFALFTYCVTAGLDFISKLVNVMLLSGQHLNWYSFQNLNIKHSEYKTLIPCRSEKRL